MQALTKTSLDPEIIPYIVNRGIQKFCGCSPQWTKLQNLPSFSNSFVNKIGTELFSFFTKTPLKDIQVISSVAGNSERSLKAVALVLQKRGYRKQEAEVVFEDHFPGYAARVEVYELFDIEFLIVEDFCGKYIYAYEPKHTLTNQKMLEVFSG